LVCNEDKNKMIAGVEDDVIQGLYEAATGLTPWADCLGHMHQALAPAYAVQLLVTDRRNGELRLAEASPGSPVDVVLEYLRQWHRLSPHVAHMAALPVGEVMNSARAFPRAQYASHPFYRDFWAAYGVCATLGAKAAQTADQVAVLGVTRTHDHPAFSAAEEAYLARCVKHLGSAFRIASSLLPVRTAGVVGLGLMQASARPMLLLDEQLGLMASNAPADGLLARADTLFVSRGQLQCANSEDGALLARAMASIMKDDVPLGQPVHTGLNGATVNASPSRTALRLGGSQGSRLLCSLWHMRPEQTQGAFGPQPVALLTINADAPADAQWLGAMFDLTPAEATVAAALMNGRDVKQIAHDHRRSVHTVRSQMRSVLQKTGARRQVDLVQMLLQASSM
jgi:DNA-binding CsgD family transcriptional regulator